MLGLATIVVAVVVMLAASPRHRSFYLGRLGAGAPPAAPESAAAPAPRASRRVRTTVRVTVPTQDAEGRVRVPVADVVPDLLPADGVPAGWELKEFVGKPEVELLRVDGRLALKLRSQSSAFALYRDVVIDPSVQSRLSWTWKVTKLPADGDVRDPARNDHAVGVYVVFPRWPSPMTNSDVLGYVWDTSAPVDTIAKLPEAPNVRFLVVDSGRAGVGQWQEHERDITKDYATVFGGSPGRVGKLAVMTDADHTRSQAEALVADLRFQRR